MSKKPLLSVTEVTSVGQGYNTFLATAMPSLVDTNTSSSASVFTPSVSICTSSHDVYNSLSIDASIAMNTLWGSFEDKMKYIKSLRVTSTSVVILVTATVENQYSIQGPPVFREQYTDAKTVYYQGGDSFVSGITQGAQFIASFVFHATTEESYQNVINTAEATFNGFSTSIDASLTTDIKNISASTQVNVQFNSTAIGLGTTPYPNVPDGVVDFALKLNTLPLTSPQVLDFATTPYSAVAGCPDFTQIVLYAVKYQDPTDSGLGISDLELMAKSCHDATTLTGITYDYYNLRGVDPSIDKNLQGLENIIQAISDWRMKVYIDPTVPNITDPTIDKTLFKEAVANYQLKSGSLYGGLGGGPFVDIQPDWIPWGVKLTGSQLWAGGAIQRIQNTYSTQLDGTSISVPYHGYDTDNTTQYSFQFGPNDTITAAGCTFENRFGDTLVENISIAVDNQDALVLPPVIFTGIQNWTFPSNSRFVGWAGRSDRYLNALQAQFVIFSPAKWKMPEMVQVRNNPFRSRPSPFKSREPPALPIPTDPSDRPHVLDDVIGIMTAFVQAKYTELCNARGIFQQKGGWEGWLQVELASVMNQNFTSASVFREERPFNGSNERVDLQLEKTGEEDQIIELKTESLFNGPRNFLTGVKIDIDSFQRLTLTKRPAKVYAVGFSCSPEAHNLCGQLNAWLPYTNIEMYLLGDSLGYPLSMYVYRADK